MSGFDDKGYPTPAGRHLWIELPIDVDQLTDEQTAFLRVRLESAALALVRMLGADSRRSTTRVRLAKRSPNRSPG